MALDFKSRRFLIHDSSQLFPTGCKAVRGQKRKRKDHMQNGEDINDRQSVTARGQEIPARYFHSGPAIEAKIAVSGIGSDQKREIAGKRPVRLYRKTGSQNQ